jgi:hypothetical protein
VRGITIFAAALACAWWAAAQTAVPAGGGKPSAKSGADAAKSPATKASASSASKQNRKYSATKSVAAVRTTSAGTKSGAKAKSSASKSGARTAAAVSSNAGKNAAKKAPPRHVAQQQPTPDRYREIQQALADRGYFHGAADGAWGAESVDALKRFQADQNLDADGKIGGLSLIGLGLGPKRESAAARPAPPPNPASVPTTESAPADPAAIVIPTPAPGPAILP